MQHHERTETHYDVIGVAQNATRSQIRTAYRARVLSAHPDHSHVSNAADITRRLVEAWQVLGDDERRRAYDEELAELSRRGEAASRPKQPSEARPGAARQASATPRTSEERPNGRPSSVRRCPQCGRLLVSDRSGDCDCLDLTPQSQPSPGATSSTGREYYWRVAVVLIGLVLRLAFQRDDHSPRPGTSAQYAARSSGVSTQNVEASSPRVFEPPARPDETRPGGFDAGATATATGLQEGRGTAAALEPVADISQAGPASQDLTAINWRARRTELETTLGEATAVQILLTERVNTLRSTLLDNPPSDIVRRNALYEQLQNTRSDLQSAVRTVTGLREELAEIDHALGERRDSPRAER